MAENKTWFTKTIARETVEAETSKLLKAGEISEEVKSLLDGLFAGKTTVSNTLVKNADGEVMFKRCSYFEGYLPISEFGTVGKNEDGTPKYSYQSKAGAAAARKAKSDLEQAIKDADAQLEVDEDVAAWKDAKAAAVKASDEKAEYTGDEVLYATYEDLMEENEDLV